LGNGDVNNQDGLRVLDAVRRLDPGCIPILLTGYATVELAVSAITDYGAFSCQEKSAFNRTEFRSLVQKALASIPPVSHKQTQHKSDGIQPVSDESWREHKNQPAILVVEDDAGWRSILSELLEEANYSVQMCSGYGEALGHLQRGHFELAVVDLNLTGAVPEPEALKYANGQSANLDGYQLLSGLQEEHIPAIVVSGIRVPERITHTFEEYGIFSYISKQTFNRQIFLNTITEALDKFLIPSELELLTERELEVLELLAQGATNKSIAENLYISTNTVKRHLKAIFIKLGVHTRSAAAAKAIQAQQH
jgi:DNA-binding NarL/FixJ family response regulator